MIDRIRTPQSLLLIPKYVLRMKGSKRFRNSSKSESLPNGVIGEGQVGEFQLPHEHRRSLEEREADRVEERVFGVECGASVSG